MLVGEMVIWRKEETKGHQKHWESRRKGEQKGEEESEDSLDSRSRYRLLRRAGLGHIPDMPSLN